MTTRRQLLLGLAATTVACGPSSPQRQPPGDYDIADRVHGKKRQSLLLVPPGLTGPAPMLIALHDKAKHPRSMADDAGWRKACVARGWLGLFPTYEKLDHKDDNAYLAVVLQRALAMGGGDSTRVFVVGHGTGGRRAYALATEHSGLLRAIAAVGAVARFSANDLGNQDPTEDRVSVLHWHGAQDEVVPLAGGDIVDPKVRTVAPLEEALKPWIAHISGVPAQAAVPAPLVGSRWEGEGKAVLRVVDLQGGHAWNPAATQLIGDFFASA